MNVAVLGPRTDWKLTPRVSKPDPPEIRLDVMRLPPPTAERARCLLYSVELLLNGFDFR